MEQLEQTSADGVILNYLELNKGASNTLFFMHGNSCSINFWRKQFRSPVFSEYRLVVFDLPGHGNSGMPPDSDCSLTGVGKIMAKAINLVSKDKPFILVGASLATNIIAEMLYEDVDPDGIVLAGPCLINDHYTVEKFVKPNTHVHVVFAEEAPDGEISKYAQETSSSTDVNDIRFFIDDYKSTQPRFRGLLAKSIGDKVYRDQIEIVKQRNLPTLVIMGAEEKIVDPDYLDDANLPAWNETIYKIGGASHLVNIDQPDEFNNLFYSFAKAVLK